jgi:outer membrane immunogenic protein
VFGAGGSWCLASRSQTNTATLTGWTAGGGIEWIVGHNWLVRTEFRYTDFGRWQTPFFAANGSPPTNGDFNSASLHVTSTMATLGIAYKLGWPGAAPITAKY